MQRRLTLWQFVVLVTLTGATLVSVIGFALGEHATESLAGWLMKLALAFTLEFILWMVQQCWFALRQRRNRQTDFPVIGTDQRIFRFSVKRQNGIRKPNRPTTGKTDYRKTR